MTKEKWLDLINDIQDKFTLEQNQIQPLDPGPGESHTLVIRNQLGRFKLERITKPRVIDKKTTFSNRLGSEVKVDYIYSSDDQVDHLNAFRWDGATDQWVELDPNAFKL